MDLEEMVGQAIRRALLAPAQAKDVFTKLDLELQDRRAVKSRALGEIITHLSQGGTLNNEQLQRLREEMREREAFIQGGSVSLPTCHECGQTLIPKKGRRRSYRCPQCDPPPARSA